MLRRSTATSALGVSSSSDPITLGIATASECRSAAVPRPIGTKMFSYIADTLRANPQLAIFLTLAIGYWIGAKKFGSFSLGAVTGTLLAGIVIGQLGIDISSQVMSIFFIMFLFAVGFGVGPQFVRGIATDGAPQAIFAC